MTFSTFWRPATGGRLALAAGLLLGGAAAAQAQALNYNTFGATNVAGAYTDLGTNGSVIATTNTDDANSAAQDIGFSFSYNGAAFTQFVLNTNGLMRLGSAAPSSAAATSPNGQTPEIGPVNSTDPADVNLLMPFNFDLISGTSPAEYRVAITGTSPNRICTIQWKNVADKAVADVAGGATILPIQYTNFSFQVKLYETTNNIEFVYNAPTVGATSARKNVVVGIKGSGNAAGQNVLAAKASSDAWTTTTFLSGPQVDSNTGVAHNVRSVAPPDAGRTYRFLQAVPNDAAAFQILTLGKLPRTALPHAVQAVIINPGTTSLSNVAVTLTVTGANSFTNTQTITSIPVGEGALATFTLPTTFVAGDNVLTVTVPVDGNNANNSVSTRQTVTNNGVFSYVPSDLTNTSTGSFGAVNNAAGTGSAGAVFAAAFTTVTGGTVTSVRVFLTDPFSVGRSVQGVVLNATGALVGGSTPYTITASDINTYKTFSIVTPPTVAANGVFQAGLSQAAYTYSAAAPRYFPVGGQSESGIRTNTFLYYTAPTAGGTPMDLAGNRFMIEASLLNALGTNSPVLARSLSLYPNPSASGIFTLDVQGAKASAGLSVDVADQLGRHVYSGQARDNFANMVNLSSLAPGIYYLTVRNGSEFFTSKLSINR